MAFYGPQAAGGTHRMLSESGGFITQSTIFFFFLLQTKKQVQELEWLTTVTVRLVQSWDCTAVS